MKVKLQSVFLGTIIYYVKKPTRFVILSSDKSSERNLSCFFDIKKPRRIEHSQSEEPFSSDPYFSPGITQLRLSGVFLASSLTDHMVFSI